MLMLEPTVPSAVCAVFGANGTYINHSVLEIKDLSI
jgi:hypothetical protein